jgi:hypothetical protein
LFVCAVSYPSCPETVDTVVEPIVGVLMSEKLSFLAAAALLVTVALLPVQAQDSSGGVWSLPRVGTVIDFEELRYFHFFDFNSDVEEIRLGERSAGGLQLTLMLPDSKGEVTLDSLNTRVLLRWLEEFESISASGESVIQYFIADGDTLLAKAASRMVNTGMLPFKLKKPACQPCTFLLRDGMRSEGYVLAARDSMIALWTGSEPYAWRAVQEKLILRHMSEIDSVLLPASISSTRHRITYWLFGALTGMLVLSESTRNAYDGPGGSGSGTTSLTVGLLFGSVVGWLPSLGGNIDAPGWRPEDRSWEDLQDALEENGCTGPPPPEVLDALRTVVPHRLPLRPPAASPSALVQVQWDAPLAIGIEMNVHAYDVRSRPYSVLPGLAFSARQSLLRSVDELPILSVMLRGSAGIPYYAIGAYLQYLPTDRLRYFLGIEYISNNDDLGEYSSSTMSNSQHWETTYQRDEWLQETFVTVGLDIPLLTSYLTLQYRHLLQPALSESVRFSGYDYHRVTNLYAPTAYGGVAVSWTAPFSLSGIF